MQPRTLGLHSRDRVMPGSDSWPTTRLFDVADLELAGLPPRRDAVLGDLHLSARAGADVRVLRKFAEPQPQLHTLVFRHSTVERQVGTG